MGRDSVFYRFANSRMAVGGAVFAVLLLVAAAVFRLIPWWLFFAILVSVVLGLVLYGLVRDILKRRRDGKFGDALDAQATRATGQIKRSEQAAISAMHGQWKSGFDRLRKSLGGGRHVYDLPWYVIIGKPATGKTTAIKHSGLHFPLEIEGGGMKGSGGTKNCDWFFAEEAILLDTAGRYTDSGERSSDQKEWLEFLKLLSKYRSDMPINGLLVAVAADDLLGKDLSDVSLDARQLRGRLDELIGELKIQFPVYVIVTKCDLVPGFPEFFGKLPKGRRGELVGWTNPSWEMEGFQGQLDGGLRDLEQRVLGLRSAFLRDESDPSSLHKLFVFPDRLHALTESISRYCDVLFRETRFNEAPFLRGVFLTSALQTGSTIDDVIRGLGIKADPVPSSKSYFLQDFFQERLSEDDQLVVPTGSARSRLRIFNNLGLASVVTISVLIATFATASYLRNRRLLNRIQDAIVETTTITDMTRDEQGLQLEGYWADLKTLRSRVDSPDWLERFGLFQGKSAIPAVERAFMDTYETVAYEPALQAADDALGAQTASADSIRALEALLGFLVDTKDAQKGDLDQGGELLGEFWNPDADPSDLVNFSSAYRFYLRDPWGTRNDPVRQQRILEQRQIRLARVREKLPEVLRISSVRRWLEDYGDPIRYDEELQRIPISARVSPPFTEKAWRERVEPLLESMRRVGGEIDQEDVAGFERLYKRKYAEEWLVFLLAFDVPKRGDAAIALYCDDDEQPYFEAIDQVIKGVKPPFEKKSLVGAADSLMDAAGPLGDQIGELAGAAEDLENQAQAAARDAGFAGKDAELPGWVSTVQGIRGEREDYIDLIRYVCRTAREPRNPCSIFENVASDPFAKQRDVVATICEREERVDSDGGSVLEHCKSMLSAPLEVAIGDTSGGCEKELQRHARALGEHLPEVPQAIEDSCGPRGAVKEYCRENLSSFVDCRSGRSLTKAVRVPSGIGGTIRTCGRMMKCVSKERLKFESYPSGSDRTDIKVVRTTLSASCDDFFEISHRNNEVKGSLSWSTGSCDSASIILELGRKEGGPAGQASLEEGGDFALLKLLAAATRLGNELTWEIPGKKVDGQFSAQFKVTGLDPELLGCADLFGN